MDDANQEIEKSVDVPATIWPEVMGLVREHQKEHQLSPYGAVHDALRRYFDLPVKEAPIPEPAFSRSLQKKRSPDLIEPSPDPQDALGPGLTQAFHPDTQEALRFLRMALAKHPKDRAAAAAELLTDLILARTHF